MSRTGDADTNADAVRTYLRWLRLGPPAEDPIARLEARAAAERSFIDRAKRWADAARVTTRPFIEEGVDPDVLRRAGFRIGSRSGARANARDEAIDDIQQAMPRRHPFTEEGLMRRTGRPIADVRRAIMHAEQNGEIIRVAVSELQGRYDSRSVLYRRRGPADPGEARR